MNGAIMTRAFNGIFVDDVWVINTNIEGETFVCDYCGERHLRGDNGENVYVCGGEEICEACANEDTYICDRCGERHHIDNSWRVYSCGREEIWCEDCADWHAHYCEECGEYFDEDDTTYIEDTGNYVCLDCRDRYYTECADCGEWYRNDSVTETSNGEYVCDSCLEENYTWDDDEEEWVSNEVYEMRHGDNEGVASVDDSGEDSNDVPRSDNARVRSYHSRPTWWNEFVGAPNALSNTAYAGVGVELEVDLVSGRSGYRQRALNRIDRITGGNKVYFNQDCSLHEGFEIISRPHTLEAFNEMPWEEIMRACTENGFSSHDAGTCGLHFHFSRLMFGDDEETQDDNIAKLMQFFEFYWDDIVKVSRREGNQLRWCGRKGYVSKKRIKKYVKDKCGGHDEAINNANTHTVEIRVMRGTLNYETFKASLDFLVTLIKNACRIGWDEVCEAEEMLKGIKPETCDYLMRKNAFYREAYAMRYNG